MVDETVANDIVAHTRSTHTFTTCSVMTFNQFGRQMNESNNIGIATNTKDKRKRMEHKEDEKKTTSQSLCGSARHCNV